MMGQASSLSIRIQKNREIQSRKPDRQDAWPTKTVMRPAFASTQQTAAFALLLLLLLLSPVLAGKKFLPSREQAYATRSWGSAPFPWIQNQIFQETNAIDIVFIGSSHILQAVDTPY